MNRLIIIGNGFDLAHGLQTRYSDFLDWIKKEKIYNKLNHDFFNITHEDEIVFYNSGTIKQDLEEFDFEGQLYIDGGKRTNGILYHKNYFLQELIANHSKNGWSDIENEYYGALIKLTKDETNQKKIERLQRDFNEIIALLEKYLIKEEKQKTLPTAIISRIIDSEIKPKELSQEFLTYIKNIDSKTRVEFEKEKTVLLNFNYTNLSAHYEGENVKTIHIHGELNDPYNPIIFGYGDELDDEYENLEKSNYKNVLFNNIKSVNYLKTDNYRKLNQYINSNFYQILIIGHSCGNTDRTLLNLLFEHPNCVSIKPFYRDYRNGKNNYFDLTVNISRNFNNKLKLRDRVVPEPDTERYC